MRPFTYLVTLQSSYAAIPVFNLPTILKGGHPCTQSPNNPQRLRHQKELTIHELTFGHVGANKFDAPCRQIHPTGKCRNSTAKRLCHFALHLYIFHAPATEVEFSESGWPRSGHLTLDRPFKAGAMAQTMRSVA
jgi:hypothetical protein